MANKRASLVERLADLCGDSLLIRDARNGWPAHGEIMLESGPQPVALHLGPVTLSHRERDDIERRFQNPGQQRPVTASDPYFPLLLGLWEEEGRPVIVGMNAEKRLGRETRFSLFMKLQTLKRAQRVGWADDHSATDELIVAFHPALLPAYLQVRMSREELPQEEIQRLLQATGLDEDDSSKTQNRARKAAAKLARDHAFRGKVVSAYDGLCAMCEIDLGLIQGAHIYPVSAPDARDEVWNGLALCGNHHSAFDKHAIHVEPVSREIRLHPAIRADADRNKACERFVELTRFALKEPKTDRLRPRAEMFEQRYDYYDARYDWAS